MTTRLPRETSTPLCSTSLIRLGLKTRTTMSSEAPVGRKWHVSPWFKHATPTPSVPRLPTGTALNGAIDCRTCAATFTCGGPRPAAPGKYVTSIGFSLRLSSHCACSRHLACMVWNGSSSTPRLDWRALLRSNAAPMPPTASIPLPGMTMATPRPAFCTGVSRCPSRSNMRRKMTGSRFVDTSPSRLLPHKWSAGRHFSSSLKSLSSAVRTVPRLWHQASSRGSPTWGYTQRAQLRSESQSRTPPP
mmetsp:Transcript_41593/g.115752  ORF Transcript_41593/g.115752 Transcript_41593/m.115752 type:complete len:246 (-) Transcript_41593:387-1124(-)